MNIELPMIVAIFVVALAVPVGHGQDPVSLRAESARNRLVLVGKNATWEQVRSFGLIVERSKDITDPIRAAVADTTMQLESTNDGFTLDFGPSGGMGRGNDGVVSLALSSGKVASVPLRVERTAFAGFCLNPVLGDWGSHTPLARYAMEREEGILNVARSPDSPVLAFRLEDDHLVLTVTGASWNEVQAITWRRVEGQDRTSVLQEALASGTARVAPTCDGFILEIEDAHLPEGTRWIALTLDSNAVVASPLR